MMNLIAQILAAYIITVVLVEGHIFSYAREYARQRLSLLRFGGTHLFDCRLCVGFYISVGLVVFNSGTINDFLIIYGASYFLATQER